MLMADLTRNMNELPSHEKRVCLFAAQQLASGRNGGFVTIDSYPDEEERQQPAIDLLAHDSLGSISVEHTLIESYSTQLHDNAGTVNVLAVTDGQIEGWFVLRGIHVIWTHGALHLTGVTTTSCGGVR
jgi:hypothetical protein